MGNLEYIETYFNEELSPEKKMEFELRITKDREFAEEVAFYLYLKEASAAELTKEKERFKEIYEQYKRNNQDDKRPGVLQRKLLIWGAAAATLAGIIFGLNVWLNQDSSQALASKYIVDNFQTLSVKMSSKADSIEGALRLYNEGRQEEALKQFENMILKDSSLFEAKKYAGIVSLWLGQYDKAISYFSALENFTQLYANPGKFYHAITLLKRDLPNDKQAAKELLLQVVNNDLEGKEPAEKILDKW